MGFGDELMASGMARGLAEQGKRAAFGDGRKIRWSQLSPEIFRGNPNIAEPGTEGQGNLVWFEHYPGARAYHGRPIRDGRRWRYNMEFRATPGQVFLTKDERQRGLEAVGDPGFILIEPHTKKVAPNKQWGADRWRELADRLRRDFDVAQFNYGEPGIPEARQIKTKNFREAIAAVAHARCVILPEGGLHHAAAAMNRLGVVLFGGFTPPELTGYKMHVNIFTGGKACGQMKGCAHCREAMAAIKAARVESITRLLMR